VYPVAPHDIYHKHFVLHSTHGRIWRALPTQSLTLQHQTAANVNSTGYFTVGIAKQATIPKPFGGSTGVPLRDRRLIGATVLGFIVAIVVWRWRNRQSEKAGGRGNAADHR
jgi:hypothetical protein